MVQVVHAVQGRARYAVQGLYKSPALKRYLENHLGQMDEVESVRANPQTGTVLVKFDRPLKRSHLAEQLDKLCFQFQRRDRDEPSAPSASERRKPSRTEQRNEGAEQTIRDWHSLAVDDALAEMDTDAEGLSDSAATDRQAKYGANALSTSEGRSDLTILVEQFQSLPVALLGGASVLSAATGGLIDSAVILGVVGINAIVGFVTESQSENIIQSLQQREEQTTKVLRAGEVTTLDADEVVPGDVLRLEAGQVVAADARLMASENLSVNESSLTGESEPVAKRIEVLSGEDIPLGDRHNMVYKGTTITNGTGRAVVVATGRFTEIGKIQQMVGEAESDETPLQRQLDEVGTQLAMVGSGVCGLVFGIGLLRGYGLLEMLKISISLAVAAVPEGLPTIATTTLALGMDDMRQRHILIRQLEAVEALGSVQTICLDKTGTLTQNQMVVQQVRTGQDCLEVEEGRFIREGGEAIAPDAIKELQRLVQVGVLCSEVDYESEGDGDYSLKGSSTENALIHLAIASGVDVPDLRNRHPVVETNLRTEDRSVMSTVHTQESDRQMVAVKGSPAEVLERCEFWMRDGETVPLEDDQRRQFDLDNERMAGEALRVLGVAFKEMAAGEDEAESHLVWLGLVGMADPLREGVQDLMQQFHRAGINTVMITGDQSATAYAIAKALNISRRDQIEILDSFDLAGLEPEKMQALFDKVDVFARVSPASKLQIVQALQNAGKVVAMTGDGINDMPALKAANVGVAMGQGSSDVVQDVADMIIEDNNLQTLINAVGQGRTTYNNIRKSVHFLLSTNMGEIIVTTLATALGLGEPLNTMELLWLNLVTDIFPGLALAMEPPEPDILNQLPRSPDEPILRESDFTRIALESATISGCALAAYSYSLLRYGQGPKASTTLFMSLTIGQVLHTWSCRSETNSIFDRQQLPRNPYAEGAIAASLGLQLLPIFVPPLRNLLGLALLDPVDWSVVVSTALLALIINESTKTGEFPIKRKPRQTEPKTTPETDTPEAKPA